MYEVYSLCQKEHGFFKVAMFEFTCGEQEIESAHPNEGQTRARADRASIRIYTDTDLAEDHKSDCPSRTRRSGIAAARRDCGSNRESIQQKLLVDTPPDQFDEGSPLPQNIHLSVRLPVLRERVPH